MHTDSLVNLLGLDPDKVHAIYPEMGNIGPASVPIVLARAVELGKVRKGDRACVVLQRRGEREEFGVVGHRLLEDLLPHPEADEHVQADSPERLEEVREERHGLDGQQLPEGVGGGEGCKEIVQIPGSDPTSASSWGCQVSFNGIRPPKREVARNTQPQPTHAITSCIT